MQHLGHPLRRARLLWFGVAWVCTAVLFILGVAYLFTGGQHLIGNGQAYTVVQHFMPGRMRTHGAIMAILGILMAYCLAAPVYGMAEPRRMLRHVLQAVIVYQAWTAFAFAAAPFTGGVLGLALMVWWCASVIITVLLVTLPPPTLDQVAADRVRSGRA